MYESVVYSMANVVTDLKIDRPVDVVLHKNDMEKIRILEYFTSQVMEFKR